MNALRVAVVGCGVAGMAAGLALARLGAAVTVLERFATPRPLGAGLLLQPTGLAALARLGLADTVIARGAPIHAVEGHTRQGRTVLDLRYPRWRPDAFGLGIHRAALFEALYGALQAAGAEIRTGADIARIEPPDAAGRRALTDAAGHDHGPFDLVAVADGAHSALRAALAPKGLDRVYPWAALWTVRPDPEGRWAGALRQVYDGARRMMGVLPVGEGQAAVFWSLPAADHAAWRAAGPAAFQETLEAHWPAAATLLRGLEDLEAFTFATYRDVALRRWRGQGALLLGDAAHATSPQLGQGANLALGDALALADALAATGGAVAPALAAYERARRPAVAWTQLVSRALTPVFQSDAGWIGAARDLALHPVSAVWPFSRLMLATLVGAAALPSLGPRKKPDFAALTAK